tara:strand:- start:232 stop:552 length:321 start_codon:yes stop_codon:yes gene_type:complete
MTWQNILKSNLLEKVDSKKKKKLKKLIQMLEPSEFLGKEMTQLTELIDELKDLDLIKTDTIFKKNMKKYEEKNLDILASAAKVRKNYETLYSQLRAEIYPKKKGKV